MTRAPGRRTGGTISSRSSNAVALARKRHTGEEAEPALGEVLEFLRLVWAVDHRLQSASKQLEARLGITGPQRLAVRIIGRFPGIGAGEIATLLHLHPSTVTGVLQRLEGRGLITRSPDPADARRALSRLTEAGWAMNAVRAGTVEATARRLLARLDEAEIQAAERVLRALAEELERDFIGRASRAASA